MGNLDDVMDFNDEDDVDDMVASRWLMIVHVYFSFRDVFLECSPLRMAKLVLGRTCMVCVS